MTHNPPLPVDTIAGRDMLNVEVQLFAAAAQRAGTRRVQVCVPRAASLTELRRQLIQLCPELAPLVDCSRWALDCEFVESDYLINGDVSLAMIPPVSGG